MSAAPTPSAQTPVSDQNGYPTPTWFRFFASLGAAAKPGPVMVVQGNSPLTFTAPTPGVLSVQGGTITALTMMRGGVTLTLPASPSLIPLGKGDQVTVTFSAAPTMSFLPS